MAEASALRDGLLLAQQIGCSHVQIQADCSKVVNTMFDGSFLATTSAAIFEECNHLWEEFTTISITHCHRESKQVAQELARQARLEGNSCVWIDDPPASVRQLLVNDVTILSDQ